MKKQFQQMAESQPSLFKRAEEMSKGKSESELEQIARNICASKGICYDDALKQFYTLWK